MAEPEVRIGGADAGEEGDVEMQGGDQSDDVVEVSKSDAAQDGTTGAAAEGGEKPAQRVTFVDYLKSPIISLVVGTGSSQTTLTAHKALLARSPFFSEKLTASTSQVDLADEDLDAISCFLEYLYTGEYFPHKLPSGTLEPDPEAPRIDDSGAQLLKHAKVYTLVEKLGMPTLKSLSHSKIHLVTSTAIAELAYARYVYSHTSPSDFTIRKPVASFWGQRSHVLRHETEGSFRDMCLQFPAFSYDLLTFVLDQQQRKSQRGGGEEELGKSARKRARGT
ncbi:MAG: hypothetical protein Q9212_005769 [Teloschistes hypoglaucus]